MGPIQFHRRESTANNNNGAGVCPPPLKINKDSHFIKKSSPSSSSSSSSIGVAGPSKQPHRHPVIIYTHSPKVIHTHPKDFMALVQKLTGLSRGDDDQSPQTKSENGGASLSEEENKCVKSGGNGDDNESGSSVITTAENCNGHQVNSCLLTPIFDPPPHPFQSNMPVFTPNSTEFYCGNRPFYNYGDSLFYSQNMRGSLSSSASGFDGINEFRDY